jgi:transposase
VVVHARNRGGGLPARAAQLSDRPKYPSTATHRVRRIDWARYRRFLRDGWTTLLSVLNRRVRQAPPPYSVRPPGTPGRPPTDPRDVARFLLLRALEGWSYDETHATLVAVPQLARRLGFRKVPAAPTVAALVLGIPAAYLEQLIAALARRLARPRENLAADGTGLSTHRYERWVAARHSPGHRHAFVTLQALVATRGQFPFFLAAHVTDAYTNDVTELPHLLDQLPPDFSMGNLALDKGYLSRRNAQAVADRGGRPVIDLKRSIGRVDAGGCPAWRRMLIDQRAHRREFSCRYRRRAVIEGTFGAMKARFGGWIRSRRRHAQRVEILTRAVVWNAEALTYHPS